MSSSIPVQGVIDFPIVSSFYQHNFESPKSVKVQHARKEISACAQKKIQLESSM